MEDGVSKKNNVEISILKKRSHSMLNVSDVFQPSWIRRTIQTSDGLDAVFLGYRFTFLWRVSFLFWFILYFFEKRKKQLI